MPLAKFSDVAIAAFPRPATVFAFPSDFIDGFSAFRAWFLTGSSFHQVASLLYPRFLFRRQCEQKEAPKKSKEKP